MEARPANHDGPVGNEVEEGSLDYISSVQDAESRMSVDAKVCRNRGCGTRGPT